MSRNDKGVTSRRNPSQTITQFGNPLWIGYIGQSSILGISESTLSCVGFMWLYLIEQPFLYTLQVSDGNILDKSGTAK